jgi:Flp pilus assembly protein TadG
MRNDEGSASVQMVVCFPLVMLVVLAVIQAGAWYFAVDTAQSAADHAAWAARTLNGTADGGQARAEQVLRQVGNQSLHDTHVVVSRSASEVVVTVTASGPHFVPFWPKGIRATASAPIEVETHA